MSEIFQAFGVDWRLIVIQVFNFTLMAAVLWYFLYKPVLKLISDRQEKIKQGIDDAELAAKSRAEAENEKKEILTAAHKDAERVAADAKTYADEKAASIVAQAQDKAQNVVEDAQSKGEQIKTQAMKESEAQIAKMAVLAAEKILSEKSS